MQPRDRERLRRMLRANQRRGWLPGVSQDHPGRFETGPGAPLTTESLVARFGTELEALAGQVHHAGDADEVAGRVLGLLAQHGVSEVLAWSDEALEVPGLGPALRATGISTIQPSLSTDPVRRARDLSDLDPVLVGLSGAQAGLAETGSIVVASGPGRSRLVSLLPPIHVTVLRANRIVSSLAELFETQPELAVQGSNLVVITGPSRTADIEMTLSRGVHGPREIHVIVWGAERCRSLASAGP
jgi:L-lactate dehydrogenase complex protein LldG